MVSRVIPVDPFDLVIFGATGDLARRKILPGLYRRFCDGQMPPEARIIGAARTDQDSAAWAEQVAEAIETFLPGSKRDADGLAAFLRAAELCRRGCHGRRRLDRSQGPDAR